MKPAMSASGRVRPAPEQRRAFLSRALALSGGAAAAALGGRALSADGDPAILKLPAHSIGLGQPVAAQGE